VIAPAERPRDVAHVGRLVRVDPRAWAVHEGPAAAFPALLAPGDLVVVNDAATLPASLHATTDDGARLEVRLAGPVRGVASWAAVLFDDGDWRTRTERRGPPPKLAVGAVLHFGAGLCARIGHVSAISPRLVRLDFAAAEDALWPALYRAGHPVQYSHLASDLALWDAQTAFGGRPWSVETPSAARPLARKSLAALHARGVAIASVTHAAGLSATGDPAIDRALPLPERSEVPAATVGAVARAKARGGRVVAVGTSTTRALEGNALAGGGRLIAACGVTTLRIGPAFRPRVVDGILSGLHEAGTSHHALLGAFAPPRLLALALAHAEATGARGEEFGDALLVLRFAA
jgi:S-adenosylmethionine:tRNA ribosyltransferase-isomerase